MKLKLHLKFSMKFNSNHQTFHFLTHILPQRSRKVKNIPISSVVFCPFKVLFLVDNLIAKFEFYKQSNQTNHLD